MGVFNLRTLLTLYMAAILSAGSSASSGYMSDPETGQPYPCVLPGKSDREIAKDAAMAGYIGPGVNPDDPGLLATIRNQFLEDPRPFVPKLSMKVLQTPQAEAVDRILKNKKSGYFVECGAFDGERASNTMWFEVRRGWTGLLVEQDPSYYLQIRGKNRKVKTANVCLGPHTYPTKKQLGEETFGGSSVTMDTYCFPLYSLMLALNRTRIDYFSLDVEGLELDILKTIPFDKLDIAVLTVEYIHGESEEEYIDFMATKGYKMVEKLDFELPKIYLSGNDLVFVNEKHVL